ncbi:MAG: alanine racemase [Pseudomonadota bacterium]
MARPNEARINLDALRHNLAHAKSLAAGTRVIAVVKANAYGHGATPIAQALAPLTDALAVACTEEALALRDAGIESPILLLQGVFEPAEITIASDLKLWVMVNTQEHLDWLEAAQVPHSIRCWLKVDTGMHRLGVRPTHAAEFYQRLRATPSVDPNIVLATHFACADDLESDLTPEQIAVFEHAVKGLDGEQSLANSAGILAWPTSHADWIRPGYMLYGNSPMHHAHPNAEALQPVMTLVSSVTALRDVARGRSVGYGATWRAQRPSKIATVTIGYGDGYPRLAPAGTPVLVKGQRASLAGRVSMDMITVDVTDISDVAIGDEVILWGEGLPVDEVARHVGTIGYELTTRMPARTPRVVVSD